MKFRFLPLLAFAAASLALTSCSKENEQPTGTTPESFFPLKPGHFVEYDVDSTIWDDFQCVKTVRKLQLRYSVADTFTDAQGRPSYRIEISERPADSFAWTPQSVVYATATDQRLEFVQNNLRYIKLSAPIANGQKWNGNAFIATDDQDLQYFAGWQYQYANVGQSFNPGRKEYSGTVTINQVNDSLNNPELMPTSYATRTFGKEVYATNVGLIYRAMTYWKYDPPASGQGGCRKGYSVVMKAFNNN